MLGLCGASSAVAQDTPPPSNATTLKVKDVQAGSVLIKNAKIIDGTGNAWFWGSVLVKDGRIEQVVFAAPPSASSLPQADTVVDAGGLALAPGFIDVHTHADDDFYRLKLAENFVRNGVTTTVVGNCGYSVSDVGEYYRKLRENGVAVNVSTLIGHNTVLRQVKGDSGANLTPEQLDRAKLLVQKAMEDGASGLSTGLIYTPGKYSPTEEVVELAKVAGRFGGIYATHMRSESTAILQAIDEALLIGREAGVRVQISHFKLPTDMAAKLGGAGATLGKVEAARAAGQEVWVDQYPYTASSTGISVLLPDWVLEGGAKASREMLATEEGRSKVRAEMTSDAAKRGRKDFAFAVFAGGKNAGLSVKQVAAARKLAGKGELIEQTSNAATQPAATDVSMEEQIDVIIDTHIAGGAGMVFHTMAEQEVGDILKHPLVAVASDSGVRDFGVGAPHPRGYGTNSRVLGRYVRELGILELEDAVRKMTSLPALAYRFTDRGLIREGFAADLVLFDPATVADKATFDQPHQYPAGIERVWVNGVPVFENGQMTGKLPGQTLGAK